MQPSMDWGRLQAVRSTPGYLENVYSTSLVDVPPHRVFRLCGGQ